MSCNHCEKTHPRTIIEEIETINDYVVTGFFDKGPTVQEIKTAVGNPTISTRYKCFYCKDTYLDDKGNPVKTLMDVKNKYYPE